VKWVLVLHDKSSGLDHWETSSEMSLLLVYVAVSSILCISLLNATKLLFVRDIYCQGLHLKLRSN